MNPINPSLRERARAAFERSINSHNNEQRAAAPNPATIARMEDAVRRMPRLQRDILLAVRLDGYGYREIANRTGLTEKQVERTFAQAIDTLCHNLDDPSRGRWRRWL